MSPRPPGRAAGFTLVEVLVALFILAILSGMAFRGVDAIVRAKDRALAETDRTLKFNTGISQFEYDVSQMVNTRVVDPIAYDGATLRLTRQTPDGMQLVVWTLQDHRWLRWASAPLTHVSEMQDAWMRTQQWSAIEGNAVAVLDGVDAFHVYTTCPAGGGGWGNVQSSCSAAQGGTTGGTSGTPGSNGTPGANGTPGSNGTPGTSSTPGTPGTTGGKPGTNETPSADGTLGAPANRTNTGAGDFPTGIRIQLALPEGTLTRDRELPAL